MTKFDSISVMIDCLQLLVAAGGFWIIYRTLRVLIDQTALLKNSVAAGANASVGDRQLEADRVLVENPGLRKYFFENVEAHPDSPDYPAAACVAQLLANYFDTYFLQRRSYPQLYEHEGWMAYVESHIAGSPILRSFIEEHASWFSVDLVDVARTEAQPANSAMTQTGMERPKKPVQATAGRGADRAD